jgi:pimeloyl-ACP methyl ester carboxylesterase
MNHSNVPITGPGTFEHSGCSIHYWLAGPPNAPLVIFTHGVTMDHHMFAAQVDALHHHYRVLTWDVRGHNESQPLGASFSIARIAEDLLALLNHIGGQQAILVGHSMGGLVAQELLFRHPERVIALVTVGSFCVTLKPPKVFTALLKLSPAAINLLPYPLFKSVAARHITATIETRAYIQQVLDRISKQQFVTMWTAVVNCIHPEPGYRITHPLLITCGQRDYLGFGFIKQQTRVWSGRDTGGQCIAIPGSAHNAHQENPTFFNRLLLEFLQEITRYDPIRPPGAQPTPFP